MSQEYQLNSFNLSNEQIYEDCKNVYLSISVDTDSNYNFKDVGVYGQQCWAEEVSLLPGIVELIEEGERLAGLLYTYRSISHSFSKMERVLNVDKIELNSKLLHVIGPEMNLLVDLVKYNKTASEKISALINLSIDTKRIMGYHFSESMIRHILRLVDRLIILETFKDLKPFLNDDFCYFKQANELSGCSSDFKMITDYTAELDAFLSKKNFIIDSLKKELIKNHIKIYELQKFLALCLNYIVDWLEEKTYMTHNERFGLLRCMSCLLYLIDIKDEEFKLKTLKWSRIAKIFKHYPIVPVFGDVQISILDMASRTNSFSEELGSLKVLSHRQLSLDYELVNWIEKIRSDFESFNSEFTYLLKELEAVYSGGFNSDSNKFENSRSFSVVLEKRTYKSLLEGMRVLCNWTSKLLFNMAWRYSNFSVNNAVYKTQQGDLKPVTISYGYSSVEKTVFLEMVYLIKSLGMLLFKNQNLILPVVKSYMHRKITETVQIKLHDVFCYTMKHKKMKHISSKILQLRSLVQDWDQNSVDSKLSANSEKKSDVSPGSFIPNRVAMLSQGGLQLFRYLLHTIFNAQRKKSFLRSHDLSEEQLSLFEEFYKSTFYYSYVNDYPDVVKELINLGELWYREQLLDTAKSLQYEIHFSLPWSLVDYDLKSKVLYSLALYPLDIYNDAAYYALYQFNKQHLYREIEAEALLALEQLVYKLSEKIFVSYKVRASIIKLNICVYDRLKSQYPEKDELFDFKTSNFKCLYREFVQILGRVIDLNVLISEHMYKFLCSNLVYAITRYESTPISAIIELQDLVDCVRQTYMLMIEDGLKLPTWELIVSRLDDSDRLQSFHGRIILHSLFEIVSDLNPNYVYDSSFERFVRGESSARLEENVPRRQPPKVIHKYLYGTSFMTQVYSNAAQAQLSYFGLEHLISYIELTGKSSLSFLLHELLMNMSLLLSNVIEPYMTQIGYGMPYDRTNLPKSNYGTEGLLEQLKIKFLDIANYPPLFDEVFQCFREWGNYVILFFLLDIAVSHVDLMENVQAAPFFPTLQNVQAIPRASPLNSTRQHFDIHKQSIHPDCHYSLDNISKAIEACVSVYDTSSDLWNNFLASAILGVKRILEPYHDKWGIHAESADNQLIPINRTFEFYRLWSVIQFVFITDIEINSKLNKSSLEIVGQGFLWAGATVIHFLRQKHRFHAMDFTYYISDVDSLSWNELNTSEQTPAVQSFLERARQLRQQNDFIYSLLDTIHPIGENTNVVYLSPPATDADAVVTSYSLEAYKEKISSFYTTTTTFI